MQTLLDPPAAAQAAKATTATAASLTERTPLLVCLDFIATLEMLSKGTNNNGQIPSMASSLFRYFLSSVARFSRSCGIVLRLFARVVNVGVCPRQVPPAP